MKSVSLFVNHRSAIYNGGISVSKCGKIKPLRRDKGSSLLKNYDLTDRRYLGQGANGRVETATRKGVDIAVKTCTHSMSERVIESCISEALIHFTMTNEHPSSTVRLKKLLISDAESQLVMEIGPKSVKKVMNSGEVSSLDDFKQIFLKSIEVIQNTHKANVAHKDLKMDNLLTEKDEHGQWKVLIFDFGLSSFSQAPLEDDHFWVYSYLSEFNSAFRGRVLFNQVQLQDSDKQKLDLVRPLIEAAKEREISLDDLYQKVKLALA